MFTRITVVLFLFAFAAQSFAADLPSDLDTRIVLATFKIANPKSTGTGFIITREIPVEGGANKVQRVLVTALHVFEKAEGDESTLFLRKKETVDGADSYTKVLQKIRIRDNGKALWTRLPNVDVAVMAVVLPAEVEVPTLGLDVLASDETLKKFEIHPGDSMRCAGYPHPNQFTPNEAWFPVVRQGCIASFPLLPTKKTRTFLTDFNTFEGNSGGAVYFSESNRFYRGTTHEGRTELILGLLSSQHFLDEKFTHVYESGTFRQRLGLGVIVHASAIREAIELLGK